LRDCADLRFGERGKERIAGIGEKIDPSLRAFGKQDGGAQIRDHAYWRHAQYDAHRHDALERYALRHDAREQDFAQQEGREEFKDSDEAGAADY
jgi:hypothetical protein